MDVTFGFASAANSGEFKASLFFSTPSRGDLAKNDAELTFEILKITHDHKVNSDAKRELSTEIGKQVRLLIETEFEKIVAERITDKTAV
ncbi:hypothetical protein IDN75_004719 [Salmonella enterica]|nr:hypothetical protein [Salmonella enterica]